MPGEKGAQATDAKGKTELLRLHRCLSSGAPSPLPRGSGWSSYRQGGCMKGASCFMGLQGLKDRITAP